MIMNRCWIRIILIAAAIVTLSLAGHAATILSGGQPAQLDIRAAGDHSIRVTLRPVGFSATFPFSPALVERRWPDPAISLRSIDKPVARRIGGLRVSVKNDPQLTIEVTDAKGQAIQTLVFDAAAGNLGFQLDSMPVLGMGEGGPQLGRGWQQGEGTLQFDRRGALDPMVPRWQAQVYGSRNPVALLVGTAGCSSSRRPGWRLTCPTRSAAYSCPGNGRRTPAAAVPWPRSREGRRPPATPRESSICLSSMPTNPRPS
jgi:hypothetical protein